MTGEQTVTELASRFGQRPKTIRFDHSSLWRPLTYECGYLHALGGDARSGGWIEFYNNPCPHAAHGGAAPAGVYRDRLPICADR